MVQIRQEEERAISMPQLKGIVNGPKTTASGQTGLQKKIQHEVWWRDGPPPHFVGSKF